MNEHSEQKRSAVLKAFFQLNFYIQALELPFTVEELYREAYQTEHGANYNEDWLEIIHHDKYFADVLDEPFTTHTFIETLLRAGHDRIVKLLMKRVRDYGVGFAHAYVMGISRWK
ncbi:hypothetical protein LSG31_16120 [Fodinisporobacter ferrooxydans]|uniref:Uncharacterized protein n=1 Tax=Fodinisporobacter ferrooxydans TaxID=2901836 RepID=A0ABY4CFW8_9BACL|nr:hypothetical protein LSG31_16120 [Alicyclobacillaceae bacterium MYW30-H2]